MYQIFFLNLLRLYLLSHEEINIVNHISTLSLNKVMFGFWEEYKLINHNTVDFLIHQQIGFDTFEGILCLYF